MGQDKRVLFAVGEGRWFWENKPLKERIQEEHQTVEALIEMRPLHKTRH